MRAGAKFVVFFLAAVLCPYCAFAEVRVGARGGVNLVDNDITGFDGKQAFDNDRYTGYFAGLTFQVDLSGGFGLDLSALYSQKGFEVYGEREFKQQSVAVPALLNYSIGLGNFFGVFLQAGPQINFNVGDTEMMISNAAMDSFRTFELEDHSWSFNVGGGLRLFRNLQLSVNYNMPLSEDGVDTFFRRLGGVGDTVDAGLLIEDYSPVAERKFESSTLQFSLTVLF